MSASGSQLTQAPERAVRAWLVALVVAVAVGVGLPACGDGDSPPPCPGVTAKSCPDDVPSYDDEIAPLMKARCQTCHAPENDSGLWSLGDLDSVRDWRNTILQQIRSCAQPPPDSGVYLSARERHALETWLVCGAPNN